MSQQSAIAASQRILKKVPAIRDEIQQALTDLRGTLTTSNEGCVRVDSTDMHLFIGIIQGLDGLRVESDPRKLSDFLLIGSRDGAQSLQALLG